jgi:tubulin alpha
VPRSIFVDLDPTPIDEIRAGQHKQLFDLDGLVSGKGDTENNYARGRYTIGKELLETVEDKLRRMTGQPPHLLLDTCDVPGELIFL